MTTANLSSLEINGIVYVPQEQASACTLPSGNRNVVVVDRGWIFAGDTSFTDATQEFVLSNAVWVFKWESIGFDGVIANPKSSKVTLRTIADVDIPEGAEIFCIPVADDWGL